MPGIRLAVAHTPVTADPARNGAAIRAQMRAANDLGARLVQFPEAAASGYTKSEIKDWRTIDWLALRRELEATADLARELGLWVVLGSAHPLSSGNRPHNSLYIIDDKGRLFDRYDKQYLSNSEVNDWFSPGFRRVQFEVDGIRFGCAICIEISFPELFQHYEKSGVDVVLISSYSDSLYDELLARAHAHLYKLWVTLSVPANLRHDDVTSLVAGPNGEVLVQGERGAPSITAIDVDPDDDRWEIELRRARPWRRRARAGGIYREKNVIDERSDRRTSF
ncbi:carbon-nitrogen hydrolase family protein [Pelagibius sp. Alg239-R121]|uniref:carbon-nitrogen hydrolase family protein n=1 Tax=Pelagibius sp. Alg239-R121 TaxID=2993448 RepID=UPI0024A797BC|nr:carbon-nitrogen hydrolase family protein [Pelagibius sp. Alg239-R121]